MDEPYYRTHNKLIPAAHETLCDIQFFSFCADHTAGSYIYYLFALIYVLPLSVMAFCYISVVHRLWIRKPIGTMNNSHSRPSVRAQKAKKRSTISMITLVVTFG